MSTVFDIETDGLLDELTKIHVLSWSTDGKEVHHTHDYDEMRKFFAETETLVGHNIIRFDLPAVENVLGIKVKSRLVDTLALSWYLNHQRQRHGLAGYGEEYGVPKPVVNDWNNLKPEDYAHRCDEDVKINSRLWRDLDTKLNKLYQDPSDKNRLIDYLSFKMDCAREQETLRWKLDVDTCQAEYDKIVAMKREKEEQLADAMPKNPVMKVANRPTSMYNQDGSLGHYGRNWVALCKEHHRPESYVTFKYQCGVERANPNSVKQVKDWLESLGWRPRTYKYLRDKASGDERKIAQVRKDGELCSSVVDLIDKDPAVGILDGLTVLTHRAGILKSFLTSHKDGWLKAEIAGFTNTLRFRHSKPLVNLPSVDKPYGDIVRGVLTCPEGYVMGGADMVSLEDTTKRHYMKPLDPDYVADMSVEGFDPHLDLAKHAGVVTQEDINAHNSGKVSLKALRKNFKVVNYSATYGIGEVALSRGTGMTNKEAKALLDAFWSRNWAIERVAKGVRTRELFGSKWLLNPVSGFFYSLRGDKDRFSTLNQGTGVFCFDTWVEACRERGIQTIGQFHDEIIALVKVGEEGEAKKAMEEAVVVLNEKVDLNVHLGMDLQFGKTYADIH